MPRMFDWWHNRENLGARVEQLAQVGQIESAVVRQRNPSESGPGPECQLLPRHQIGVMLHPVIRISSPSQQGTRQNPGRHRDGRGRPLQCVGDEIGTQHSS